MEGGEGGSCRKISSRFITVRIKQSLPQFIVAIAPNFHDISRLSQ